MLKELIQDKFVDIHSHILPGIDDGAKNIEQSLEIISEMEKMGFSKIIGTPHTYSGIYDNTNKTIEKSYNLISSKSEINIKIDYASEYMIDENIVEKAEDKSLLCIKDNFILLELSYISPPLNLYEILFKINLCGYKIILAHPERYPFYFNDFNEYYKLKNAGCYFQLNLTSTVGHYGNDVINVAEKLLKNKLIDFVGSDVHNLRHISYFTNNIKIKNIKLLREAMERNNIFY